MKTLPLTGADQPAGYELQACNHCNHSRWGHAKGAKHKGQGECRKCGCPTFGEGLLKTIFETHEKEANS